MRDNACEKCKMMRKKYATSDVCLKGNAEREKHNSHITPQFASRRGHNILKKDTPCSGQVNDELRIEDLN